MKISKLYIKNYRMFEKAIINLNEDCNIFVGDNDSGKSTLLEIIQVLLNGKVNNYSFERQLKASFFNSKTRSKFKDSIEDTSKPLEEMPSIVAEMYFLDNNGENSQYKGNNNELGEDCPGIRMSVEFNPDYTKVFKSMLEKGEIYDIPVEFYRICWRDFGDNPIVFRTFPVKVSLIDTTQKDYDSAVNKFINSRISSSLSQEEKVDIARAHRKMKHEFNSNPNVLSLNERLAIDEKLDNKAIKFSMREEPLESWMDQVSIDVENIPFEDMGFGTQNLIKMELVFKQNTENSSVVLFEEPENNLAFGNMSRLISKINQNDNKQIFISTHSSYVANKLGLKNIILLYKGNIGQLNEIKPDTMNFFKKLPGYGTVRFLLADKVILVEGPTDELIVQRAYRDLYHKLPIEDGIDIITVDSLAFKRYCELAALVRKPLKIITDNDGDIQRNITDKYKEYIKGHESLIEILYETDESLRTIEPSVLAVNSAIPEIFSKFKRAISKSNSMVDKSKEEVESFMLNNKAEWGMRVFDSEECIEYPAYILNAIR